MRGSELRIELHAIANAFRVSRTPYTEGIKEMKETTFAIRKLNKHSAVVSALCATLPSSARKSSRAAMIPNARENSITMFPMQ